MLQKLLQEVRFNFFVDVGGCGGFTDLQPVNYCLYSGDAKKAKN